MSVITVSTVLQSGVVSLSPTTPQTYGRGVGRRSSLPPARSPVPTRDEESKVRFEVRNRRTEVVGDEGGRAVSGEWRVRSGSGPVGRRSVLFPRVRVDCLPF